MLKEFIGWMNEEHHLEYYTNGSMVKTVAFCFMALCSGAVAIALFVTAPVWIVPYIIYSERKGGAE